MIELTKEQGQAACEAFNAALRSSPEEWHITTRQRARLFDPSSSRPVFAPQPLLLRIDRVRPHGFWTPKSPRYIFTLGNPDNSLLPAGQYEMALSNRLVGNSAVEDWHGPSPSIMANFDAIFFKKPGANAIKGMTASDFIVDEFGYWPEEKTEPKPILKGYENGGAW